MNTPLLPAFIYYIVLLKKLHKSAREIHMQYCNKCPHRSGSFLFQNEEIMKKNQDRFISKELLVGKARETAAKSRMLYKKLELTETILINELPSEFKALYEHKHMVNTMHCSFTSTKDARQLDQEIHYTKFNGFVPKVMAKLFPGIFKKQLQKWLDQFKEVVERQSLGTAVMLLSKG